MQGETLDLETVRMMVEEQELMGDGQSLPSLQRADAEPAGSGDPHAAMMARSIVRLLAVASIALSVPAVARPVDRSPTAPLPPGDYLTSVQIKALVAGKTLSIPRHTPQLMGTPQSPEMHYYAPHGTAYFMVRAQNLASTIGRGTWSSDNNRLCTQGFKYAPCFGIRRAAGGQLEAVYTSHVVVMGRDFGDHWPITIENGDAQNIRAQINTTYPYDFANTKPSE